ncbi:MAG: adenylate/guanylate cyclase domain-containing protein [Solirubrobacterales bacterium]
MPEQISQAEVARRAGVSTSTLRRWVDEGVIPLADGEWTPAAAAQARVLARLRDRGHSLEALSEAADEGRLAFGLLEDMFPPLDGDVGLDEASELSGLAPELLERITTLLGTPTEYEGRFTDEDMTAFEHMAGALRSGFPLVAFLQLLRVYAQSMRKIADAEARLFHLYVHEPMIRDTRAPLEMAEDMEALAGELMPEIMPIVDYLHRRYLRYFITHDLVGHMEGIQDPEAELDRVSMAFCFVDLTGFTRFTEEEGDEEALDRIERFIETTEATLPPEATIVKTIGDELMIVSPAPAMLCEWIVGFLTMFDERPKPRAGIHYGAAVYRDGDYFGSDVNLAARVVARALGGEVLVTGPVVEALGDPDYLDIEGIGEVRLKGFPQPNALYAVRSAGADDE